MLHAFTVDTTDVTDPSDPRDNLRHEGTAMAATNDEAIERALNTQLVRACTELADEGTPHEQSALLDTQICEAVAAQAAADVTTSLQVSEWSSEAVAPAFEVGNYDEVAKRVVRKGSVSRADADLLIRCHEWARGGTRPGNIIPVRPFANKVQIPVDAFIVDQTLDKHVEDSSGEGFYKMTEGSDSGGSLKDGKNPADPSFESKHTPYEGIIKRSGYISDKRFQSGTALRTNTGSLSVSIYERVALPGHERWAALEPSGLPSSGDHGEDVDDGTLSGDASPAKKARAEGKKEGRKERGPRIGFDYKYLVGNRATEAVKLICVTRAGSVTGNASGEADSSTAPVACTTLVPVPPHQSSGDVDDHRELHRLRSQVESHEAKIETLLQMVRRLENEVSELKARGSSA